MQCVFQDTHYNDFIVMVVFICQIYCLPKGRHGEGPHKKRLLCAQKCTRGGVGPVGVGWGGSCRGGVGHVVVG